MLKLLLALLFCMYVLGFQESHPKVPEKVFYKVENAKDLFKNFVTKYDKNYDNAQYNRRLKIFKDNLEMINKWNRANTGAVFGIGPFTDMTYDEFIARYTGIAKNATKHYDVDYEPIGGAPDSLDWRQYNYVTEVKDQKNCGSCYVFSAIGDIEGQNAKTTGQLISLSEQQGLDCDTEGRGCDGGWPEKVMQSLAEQGGSMKESDYPYQSVKQQCSTDRSKIAVKVTGGSVINVQSEDDLKDAVASHGPLSIIINVSPELAHSTGGIFHSQDCNGGLHAVLLIGYGTDGDTPYWLIKNSWGQSWNEQGYLRLGRGSNICNILQHVASSTVSA